MVAMLHHPFFYQYEIDQARLFASPFNASYTWAFKRSWISASVSAPKTEFVILLGNTNNLARQSAIHLVHSSSTSSTRNNSPFISSNCSLYFLCLLLSQFCTLLLKVQPITLKPPQCQTNGNIHTCQFPQVQDLHQQLSS